MGQKALLRIPPDPPFKAMLAMLFAHAHGPKQVIIPGDTVQATDLKITFTCVDGCEHEFTLVNTPQGQAFLTEIPEDDVIGPDTEPSTLILPESMDEAEIDAEDETKN